MTLSSSPQPPAPVVDSPRRRPGRSHWLIAALLVLLLGSGLAWSWWRARSASSATPLQGQACTLSEETPADSCAIPGTADLDVDPYPTTAEAQVDWVLRHGQPAMVIFYSTICRPCMMMEALVSMVGGDYEPTVTFIRVRSDLPANAALVRRMDVGTIPAFFFIAPSGDTKHVSGVMKQADLRAELDRLVEAAGAVRPTP